MAPTQTELAAALTPGVLDRFTRYVRIDTQAARDRAQSPSTPGQLVMGRLVVEELRAAGLADAGLDEHGYVMATLPANVEGAPVVGLIAHLDTSPDAPGAGVEPIVHERYDGGVIELPRNGTVLDPAKLLSSAAAPGTTSSPPAATPCSAPTTRPASRRS